MTESLIGVFEIAEMANVSASAVANWRKRFPDFPAPLAELKSGPVFSESQVKLWLARRAGRGFNDGSRTLLRPARRQARRPS